MWRLEVYTEERRWLRCAHGLLSKKRGRYRTDACTQVPQVHNNILSMADVRI